MPEIRLNIILNVSESGSHLRCCTVRCKSSSNFNLFISYPLMFLSSIYELLLLVLQGIVYFAPLGCWVNCTRVSPCQFNAARVDKTLFCCKDLASLQTRTSNGQSPLLKEQTLCKLGLQKINRDAFSLKTAQVGPCLMEVTVSFQLGAFSVKHATLGEESQPNGSSQI